VPEFVAFESVPERLQNVSARGFIEAGDHALIGGFILGGNALLNNLVLIRALGPSLSQSGVTDALQDPVLELHDPSGTLITTNDDWHDAQEDEITGLGLAPGDARESAIATNLGAGSYTAIVRGQGDTKGTALVEVYILP
jgi:hypothetical protein